MRSKFIVGNIITLLLMVTLFSSCSNSSASKNTVSNTTATTSNKAKEPTQKEINDKLKEEATKADFVQINGHEDNNKNKKVFVEGEITNISKEGSTGGEFTVSVQEESGVGMYRVMSLDTENNTNVGVTVKQGDKVKVYGVIDGKDDTGMPKIVATIVEKE